MHHHHHHHWSPPFYPTPARAGMAQPFGQVFMTAPVTSPVAPRPAGPAAAAISLDLPTAAAKLEAALESMAASASLAPGSDCEGATTTVGFVTSRDTRMCLTMLMYRPSSSWRKLVRSYLAYWLRGFSSPSAGRTYADALIVRLSYDLAPRPIYPSIAAARLQLQASLRADLAALASRLAVTTTGGGAVVPLPSPLPSTTTAGGGGAGPYVEGGPGPTEVSPGPAPPPTAEEKPVWPWVVGGVLVLGAGVYFLSH